MYLIYFMDEEYVKQMATLIFICDEMHKSCFQDIDVVVSVIRAL